MRTILDKQAKNTGEIGSEKQIKQVNPAKQKSPGFMDRVEGLLKTLFLVTFAVLIIAQTALTDASVRESFAKEAADGEPIGREVYLTEPCKMELKLINMESCPELKVLINGEEADAFRSDTVFLELKDGDVIELDANSMLISAQVQISAVSRNMEFMPGKTVSASDGIIPVVVADTKD